MVSRLILGCGTFGHALIDAIAAREGAVRVVDPDPGRVETLRNEKIPAETGDVTDPKIIAAAADDVDVVFVAGDDPDTNRLAASAAQAAFPGAYVLAYEGADATRTHRAALAADADRVVSPGATLLDHLDSLTAEPSFGLSHRLRETLRGLDGTLGVFTHDNPDPDAIASAAALESLAADFGVDAEACYFGEISHQENRAMVNLLELELRRCESPDVVEEYAGVALVDHSRPGVNDQLPPETPVDVVIDHHPNETEPEARFVDVRDDAGATSTLLTDYIRQLGAVPEEAIATGLLYGIRVDTNDFRREITAQDFEAAAALLPHADTGILERIESPSVSADTFDTVSRAIRNREIEGSALVSCVGSINDRDTLAQAADRLLGMEGVTTSLVAGFTEGTIYVSARTRDSDRDLGALLRDAFGDLGSAGGHADMAGAQIPLGLFSEVESEGEAALAAIVEDVVAERFFGVLH